VTRRFRKRWIAYAVMALVAALWVREATDPRNEFIRRSTPGMGAHQGRITSGEIAGIRIGDRALLVSLSLQRRYHDLYALPEPRGPLDCGGEQVASDTVRTEQMFFQDDSWRSGTICFTFTVDDSGWPGPINSIRWSYLPFAP
jgi:hypothetical protein